MRIKKLIKRIAAAFLTLLMIFSAFPISALAAGAETVIAGASNVEFGVISGSLSKYGHELHYAKVNSTSYIMWCGQYGKTSPQNTTYTKGTDYYAYLNSQLSSTTAEYVYFGYTLQFGNTTGSLSSSSKFAELTAAQCACACQQYVWQAIGGKYPSKSSWSSSYMSSDIYTTWYNATKALVNAYHNADVSFEDTTLELTEGSTTTLTDKNGYLKYYDAFEITKKGLTFKHTKGSNTLTITASSSVSVNSFAFDSEDYGYYMDIPYDTDWGNTTDYSSTENKYVYCKFNNYQNLFASEYASQQSFSVNIKLTEAYGKLKIVKSAEDSNSLDDLSGFKFKIKGVDTDGDTCFSATKTTNSKGEIEIDDLDVYDSNGGLITYTVTETSKPVKYNTPTYSPSQSVTLKEDATVTVKVSNTLKRGDLYIYKSADDGILENHTFKITWEYNGKTYTDTATTDSKGVAKFTDLLICDVDNVKIEYTVSEINVSVRYETPDDVTVKLITDDIQEVDFDNVLKKGDIKIVKTEEAGTIYDSTMENGAGWSFTVSWTWNGTDYSKTVTTGSDGTATLTDLYVYDTDNSKITYTISEGTKSDGTTTRYVIPDNQSGTLSWESAEYNLTSTFTFTNYLKRWGATVTKSDAETGSRAQGDASLSGAVYGVYKGGTLVDTYTTDSNGQFTTKYYICGDDWTIKEITASEGYLLDSTEYSVGAEAKNYTVRYNSTTNAVTEQVIKGQIAIIKHADDGTTQIETPEENATFEIYLKSSGSYDNAYETERDILVCDEYGYAISKDLPYGVYTVHQTYGWDGTEYIADFDVYISTDGTVYRYLINNAPFSAYLQIVKTDSETGKQIAYAGAGFQIYDSDGNLVTMQYTYPTPTKIDTFYTNSEGYLITPERLDYGEYTLVEVQAPYGYVLDSTPIAFTIEREASYTDEDFSITIVEVTALDMSQKGIIKITKTGEVFNSVTEADGIYTPVYEEQTLAGAVFEIYAAEDIITLDGTLRYSKGELVDIITTDDSGIAKSKELYLGQYTVVELTAPDTFYNDGSQYAIELTYQGQEVDVYTVEQSVYNQRQTVTVSLTKAMEQDEIFNIGSNGEILSVLFGLYSAEDITAADSSIIPADSLIAYGYCDENGELTFSCDLPIGFNWYVTEVSTDEHYILSDAKYEFDTEYQGQDVETIEIAINDGEDIINELIYGTVKGYKTDRETGESIEGVVFGLFSGNETEYTEDNAILTAVTDESGVFTFENVPYGSWIVKEIQPAENYLESNDIHHITVMADEQVIEIYVVNDKIPELQTTATVNGEKEICATEIFTLVDTVEYKHLIPNKEYVVKGVLMDKSTGKALVINGEIVTAETTFIPTEPSGTVTVEFTFDSKYIKADTDIVVFESLYKDKTELAVHADIDDESQTVTVKVPSISTTATVDGEKEAVAGVDITITDTVAYTNLTPNVEYTITGVLMNKSTGKAFKVNGEKVTAEVTFTPTESSGEVTVSFTFDSSVITKDTELVVFETLSRNGVEIAEHKDLTDEDQTVTITAFAEKTLEVTETPETPEVTTDTPETTVSTPKTSDDSNRRTLAMVMGLSALGVLSLAYYLIKKKKSNKGGKA